MQQEKSIFKKFWFVLIFIMPHTVSQAVVSKFHKDETDSFWSELDTFKMLT